MTRSRLLLDPGPVHFYSRAAMVLTLSAIAAGCGTETPAPSQRCSPGAVRCSGFELLTCNAAGQGEETSPCSLGCNEAGDACATCEAGTVTCEGRVRVTCNTTGTAAERILCAQRCNAASLTCAAAGCTPADRRCDGNTLYTCTASGTDESSEGCPYGCNDALDPPACGAFFCTPGVKRCVSNMLRTCTASGKTETSVSCNRGCDDSGQPAKCKPFTCTPGSRRCAGNVLFTCAASGTNETQESCPFGCPEGVESAVCAPFSCSPNHRRCSANDLISCNAAGTAETTETCTRGCSVTPSPACVAETCSANSTRCNGVTLFTCDATGSSETPSACPSGCESSPAPAACSSATPCVAYCAGMASECGAVFGGDATECARLCTHLSAAGTAGDSTGDSLQCRLFHLGLVQAGDPDGRCADASPRSASRCVPTPALVAAGDLVVTEIMKQPAVLAEADGEWFEVVNTRAAVADLAGMKLGDGTTISHTLPTTVSRLAPGQFKVFVRNGTAATNGGLPADAYAYGETLPLANGDGTIVLQGASGVEVTRLAYTAADFPDRPGVALQLDATIDWLTGPVSASASWCTPNLVSQEYSSPNRGTPGALNNACDLPTVVTTLQDAAAAGHPPDYTLVRFTAVVSARRADGTGFFMLDTAVSGPQRGIEVRTPVDDPSAAVGDTLQIVGYYEEVTGVAVVGVGTVTEPGPVVALTPETLAVAPIPPDLEPYESMLVVVEAVTAVAAAAGGEFSVTGDGGTSSIVVGRLLFDGSVGVVMGQVFPQVSGVLVQEGPTWKIMPRGAADLGG